MLAWHNGSGKKLSGAYIWNWHLNRGGSYSVSYLVQSMAFTKWMTTCFSQTVVTGLSQGGAAALLNALQTKPTLAVVSSGASLLFELLDGSGHNQLIGVPGFGELSNSHTLFRSLYATPTKWLFTWGRGESGIYKIEAEERRTAQFIEPLANVDVAIHGGGHIFPVAEIQTFLKHQLYGGESQ